MAKERHNINTIAEVLIEKFDDLDSLAKRIEKATEKSVSVDDTALKKFEELQRHNIERENAILSDFKRLSKENKRMVPTWLFVYFSVVFLALCGLIYCNLKQRDEIKELENWKSRAIEQFENYQKK